MRIAILLLFFSSLGLRAQEYDVRKHLDTLCSEYMAGRAYVDSGHIRAAEYIKNEFISLGLRAPGESYLQKFPISVNTFPGKLSLKLNRDELRAGYDFIPKSFSGSGKGRRKVVRLDTLIFSDSVEAGKFLRRRLKRKILVYKSEDYERLTGLPYDFIEKAFSSFATIELKKRLMASLSNKQYQGVSLEVIDSLFSEDVRSVKFRVETEYQKDLETQNVMAYIPSQNEDADYILLTAHYDHIGKFGEAWTPGANDNASGVSMILDMAKWYSENGNKTDYSILFVAFGAEEAGLLGSEYFVKNPPIDPDKIRFVMNLDLMGNGEDGITVVNGKVFEDEMKLMDSLNAKHNYVSEIKKRGKAANSDHYHFSERGIPAFFIYTMGGKPWYHDVYDRPAELTLDAYEEIMEMMREFFRSL